MIHAKSHPRVQHSKLWPGEVLLDQVVHRRFLSLDGSLLKTLHPIRIERPPLDSISSCGQWVILRLVVTLFTAKLTGRF